MHASVTGALAGIPEALAWTRWAFRTTFFAARDENLAAAADGAWYAVAMSERGAGSRLSQLSTSYTVEPDGGFRIKGAKTFCSGAGHADALPGRRPQRGRPERGLPVPGAGRHARADRSSRPGTRSACGPPARTTCTWT